ncbi:unnamed protein product [Phyllotreta striolata]|uniref:FYVE-type domain-containing protein n=1 Tax=Phyllotreta striolata TaxID=444603 RepID=A0A9N9TW23_PHYSR|nr:unnamed protein product [Phyllotreta striolata]
MLSVLVLFTILRFKIMEELLKLIEKLSRRENDYNKLVNLFYKKVGEFKQIDKNESGYLSEYILPKINDLCNKEILQKDILYLSLIGCQNFELLQRFIKYHENSIDIHLEKPTTLYDYCVCKKDHWFNKFISKKTLSITDQNILSKICILRLIHLTNTNDLNLNLLKILLSEIDHYNVQTFWTNYIKLMKFFDKFIDYCEANLSNTNVRDIFNHFRENCILHAFSNYFKFKTANLNEILEFIKEEEELFKTPNNQSVQFEAFMIVGNLFRCITKTPNLNIDDTVKTIKQRLLNIDQLSMQLLLLEDIFTAIFAESRYVHVKMEENALICEEKEVRLILYLVKDVLEEIKLKYTPAKDSAEHIRLSRLNKVVADATWRMELIRSVKENSKCEKFLLKYMLSSPESLIQMCLKRNDFERACQVIQIFGLEDPYLANEIKFNENLVNLRENLKKTCRYKSLKQSNPNMSFSAVEMSLNKPIEQFFKSNCSVNADIERRIEALSGKFDFFKHFVGANEAFMNMFDLAVTLPQNFENSEIMLELACENNALDCNVDSNYARFSKKLIDMYREIGKEKDLGLGEMLTSPDYIVDLVKHRKQEDFYNTLSAYYNEVIDDLQLIESGVLNSKHPSHKSILKINKLLVDYADENVKYLQKLYNYLKAFSRVLYIEKNTSDIVSNGKNTSYFDLLKINRSELMGKLLFERNLDPSEFEKYFGKLKLDYLYHVIGNCFPTINLHIQEHVTKEELYPENNLYIPTKAIITYIQKRNWLLAYILNKMYNVEGVKIDINENRVRAFHNYLLLPKNVLMQQLYNNNAILTALQNEISAQKMSEFINERVMRHESMTASHCSHNSNDSLETGEELQEDMLRSINWKDVFELVRSVPEDQAKKNRVFSGMADTVLVSLIQDGLEPECHRYALFVNHRDTRINVILDQMRHWCGEACLDVIRSEVSRFDGMQDGKLVELKMWLLHITLCEKLKAILDVSTWYTAYKMAENTKDLVIDKLLQTDDIHLLLDFIDLHTPSEALLEKINENYVVKVFQNTTNFTSIKQLFDALPFNHSIKLCYNLIKLLKQLHHLRFVVDYLMNNVNNDALKNVEISIKMLSAFAQTEQEQLLCLLYEPLNIIEILIMNTKIEKLAAVLGVLKSEVSHTEFNEEIISVEKIDEILRRYAEKSLDFRVITQPNPRLLRTPEHKLMQSLDSLSIGLGGRNFLMPDEVPLKGDWVSNNEVIECMCCQKTVFSMFNRRHHCRRCGRVVCYNCSLQRMLVPSYGDILVRVCSDCYGQTMGENESSDCNDSISTKSIDYDYWLLTDDPEHNEIVREEFSYEHAPSVSLCLSLMKFHSKTIAYPKFLLDQCNVMLKLLQPSQEPIQEIDYLLVIKMLRSLTMAAKMSSIECALHYGTSLADRILSQVDLLNLLAERGCLSLLPIAGTYSSQGPYIDASVLRRLSDRLLEREQWNLALEVSTKAGLDNTGVFAVWGKSCLRAGNLQMAREKFQRCFEKTSHFDNLSDYSVSFDSIELTKSRKLSRSSTFSSISETKPTKNPPLLNEIIHILESNTRAIDPELIVTEESDKPSGQPDSAICILNKLRNLKSISSKNYYQPIRCDSKSYSSRPPIHEVFYSECVYYLNRYGSHLGLLEFYVKHGDINLALNYIVDNKLGTDVFIEIYMKCLKDGIIGILQENIALIDSTLDVWKDYLRHICRHLEKHNMLHSLYQLQQFMGDSIRAAMTCIRFYQDNALNFQDLRNNVQYLHKAEEHLNHGVEQEQWVDVATVRRLSTESKTSFEQKAIINPSIVMTINTKDIKKHINTIWRQNELAEFLAQCEENGMKPMQVFIEMKQPNGDSSKKPADNKPAIPTLFGSTLEKIRLAVLAIVCGPDVDDGFPIAVRIVEDFAIKPIKVFCEAGKQLAREERYSGIAQLVNCIKQTGTKDASVADMCDEMLTLAVATFTKANVSGTKVEDLIKLISDKATKISAYIEAKQLKTAYFLAVKYKRMSDIRRILRESELLNQPSIKALCQKVLQSHSHTPTHAPKD